MERKVFTQLSVHEMPSDHAFNGIDVVKFICAFLICTIHITPFQTDLLGLGFLNYWIKQYICRLAVPFYFVSSGFLLFRRISLYPLNTGGRIKSFVFKNLRLLGTWTFLLFQGWKGHLWFLGALVLAVLVLTLLLQYEVKLHNVCLIAILLYVIGLFGDSYHALLDPLRSYFIPNLIIMGYDNVFGTTCNGIFFGFVFVLMGALFAQRRIVLPAGAAVFGLFASLALLYFEASFLRRFTDQTDHNLYVFLLPVEFFLFYLASHVSLPDKPVYARLRAIGILVYFTHLLVDYFVKIALKVALKLYAFDLSVCHYMISIGITVALAVVLERLSRQKQFKWMKYLYS